MKEPSAASVPRNPSHVMEPRLRDRVFSDEHRIVVFEAICNVWEFAVASHLPNADALRDELARLQQHADLTRRPDAI